MTIVRKTARPAAPRLMVAALTIAGTLTLAGCETTGTGAPQAAAAPAAPMTHQQAAADCWMSTEKGHAALPLDKRADVVDQCIKDKMKNAPPG